MTRSRNFFDCATVSDQIDNYYSFKNQDYN